MRRIAQVTDWVQAGRRSSFVVGRTRSVWRRYWNAIIFKSASRLWYSWLNMPDESILQLQRLRINPDNFELGDWIRDLEANHPSEDICALASVEVRRRPDTLANYRNVAKAIPEVERRPGVPFTFYQSIYKLPRHLRETLLDLHESEKWDRDTLREAAKLLQDELAEAEADEPLRDFKPKSSAEYVSVVKQAILTKSRSHEKLVDRYGRWVADQGFRPSTKEHPKDIVIRRQADEWLTEAKVIYRGNATNAVRAAIGQLLTYRYMMPGGTTGMLALFSENIGEAYVHLLESLGIASVWSEGGKWRGSTGAVTTGLAEK